MCQRKDSFKKVIEIEDDMGKKNTHTQQLQIEVKRKIENGGVVRAKRLTMNGKNKSSFKVKLLSDLRKVTS